AADRTWCGQQGAQAGVPVLREKELTPRAWSINWKLKRCADYRVERLRGLRIMLWPVSLCAVGGDAFAGKFAPGGVGSCQRGVIAVMNDQMHEEHQDENGTESDNDSCDGQRIPFDAEPPAQRGADRAHGPADGEPGAEAIRKQHRADAG